MKLPLLYFSILSLLFINEGCAQTRITGDTVIPAFQGSNAGFKFQKLIPGNYIYLNVDMLDNIYLINQGNHLKKINSNGDSFAVFNDVKKYGNPSYIDVNNPLKILVYYKNFSSVVILDRLLTKRNTINFGSRIFSVLRQLRHPMTIIYGYLMNRILN